VISCMGEFFDIFSSASKKSVKISIAGQRNWNISMQDPFFLSAYEKVLWKGPWAAVHFSAAVPAAAGCRAPTALGSPTPRLSRGVALRIRQPISCNAHEFDFIKLECRGKH
jgi:hypothetical protein